MKITIDLSYLNTEEDDLLSSYEGAIAAAESDYKEFAFKVAEMALTELQAQLKKQQEVEEARIAALEDMVTRRMENTGEDRRTACIAVKKAICQHLIQRDPDNYSRFINS